MTTPEYPGCPEPFPRSVTDFPSIRGWRFFECKLCSQMFTDDRHAYADLIRHLRSDYHYKRTRMERANYCHYCDLQFTCRAHYGNHCETTRHKKKEAGLPLKPNCVTCDMTFSCQAYYDRHIVTKAHARKLAPPKRDCELCGIHVGSEKQMVAHLATNKHKRKEAELKIVVSPDPPVSSLVV